MNLELQTKPVLKKLEDDTEKFCKQYMKLKYRSMLIKNSNSNNYRQVV